MITLDYLPSNLNYTSLTLNFWIMPYIYRNHQNPFGFGLDGEARSRAEWVSWSLGWQYLWCLFWDWRCSTSAIAIQNFSTISITYAISNLTWIVYLNGKILGYKVEYYYLPYKKLLLSFRVGFSPYIQGWRYFNGGLDEITLYSRAFTP